MFYFKEKQPIITQSSSLQQTAVKRMGRGILMSTGYLCRIFCLHCAQGLFEYSVWLQLFLRWSASWIQIVSVWSALWKGYTQIKSKLSENWQSYLKWPYCHGIFLTWKKKLLMAILVSFGKLCMKRPYIPIDKRSVHAFSYASCNLYSKRLSKLNGIWLPETLVVNFSPGC